MPSWKVRSNSSERAKSWITSARQGRTVFASVIWIPAPASVLPRDEWSLSKAQVQHPCQAWLNERLGGARREQGVGGGAAGAFAVDLRLHAGDLRAQHVDAFLQFGHRIELQVFPERL